MPNSIRGIRRAAHTGAGEGGAHPELLGSMEKRRNPRQAAEAAHHALA